jgi:tetratricopeptide (TPR) repeat protein
VLLERIDARPRCHDLQWKKMPNRGRHGLRPGVEESMSNISRAIDLYNRSLELRRSGQLAPALAALNECLSLAPQYDPAFFQRAMVQEDLKNFAAAVSDYTQSIVLHPNDVDGPNAIAYARHELAVKYFNRGLVQYYDLGDQDAGIADWQASAELGHAGAITQLQKLGRPLQ